MVPLQNPLPLPPSLFSLLSPCPILTFFPSFPASKLECPFSWSFKGDGGSFLWSSHGDCSWFYLKFLLDCSRFYLQFATPCALLLDCSWFYMKLLTTIFLCVQLVALFEAFCSYCSSISRALVLVVFLLCTNLFLLHLCCALILTTLLLRTHLFLLCSCCAFVFVGPQLHVHLFLLCCSSSFDLLTFLR